MRLRTYSLSKECTVPGKSRKFTEDKNFPGDWERILCPVAASQTHATWGITCDGAPLIFLEINKEKLELIRFRVLDVLTLVTWELMGFSNT